MMEKCVSFMKKVKDSLLIVFFLCILQSCSSRSSPKTFLKHYGNYCGDFAFFIDTVNNRSFAILSSSASQVYKGDNSFDCKMLLLEDFNAKDSICYSLYNTIGDSPKSCGKATLIIRNDTTIELNIHPNKENVGMCGATIDFESNSVLEWCSLTDADK